jgi:putative oxidoreductase
MNDQRVQSYGALVLRVSLGAIMIAHALLKLLVFTLPGTAGFFAAHGFPGWTAYPVFALELVGGALLGLGLGVRIVAIGLIPVMAGALMVHWPNGWMFTAPNGGWEYVAFIIAALVAQALLGGGALALGGRCRGKDVEAPEDVAIGVAR